MPWKTFFEFFHAMGKMFPHCGKPGAGRSLPLRVEKDIVSGVTGYYTVGMALPERHVPARRALDDLGMRSNLVFVTVCSNKRKPILGKPDIHELLRKLWSDSAHWLVGRYILMPDHLHLFCAPAISRPNNVRDWVAYWKSCSSSRWPRPGEQPVWQREAWDRQVRRGESYGAKWEYVRNNSVRAGLVACADDWPYQGELNQLVWHEL